MICKSVAFFVQRADDFALHYKITIIIPCNMQVLKEGSIVLKAFISKT